MPPVQRADHPCVQRPQLHKARRRILHDPRPHRAVPRHHAKLKNEYRGKVDICVWHRWDLLSEEHARSFDYWIGSAHHLYGKNTGKYYEDQFPRPEDLLVCINNDFGDHSG